MSSLRNADVRLRTYIKQHSLPEIYEALLCGLCIMCPENPLLFLEDKLKQMIDTGHETFLWDVFIDETKKPKIKAVAGSYLDHLFGQDEDVLVSPELFKKAYSFYINNLQRLCFDAWIEFCSRRQANKINTQLKLQTAEAHHANTVLKSIIHRWNSWTKTRKQQQILAATRIQNVFNDALMKKILKAWNVETQDSKKKREYFERLERGDMEDYGSLNSSSIREGEDDISQLPLKAVLKIFGFVDLIDLARCAEVCRSWKIITQHSSLWSSIDFFTVRHLIQDKFVVSILRKCRPYVIRLNLRSCSSLHWASFKAISECKNLQDLNVSECQSLNDESMKIICEGCPALLYLNVSHTNVTNASLRMMSRCLPNLQYVSLAYSRKFTDKGLQYLGSAKGCHKLIYLDLSGCTQISVEGFRFIAAGCSSLQQLKINDMFTLTDNCILALLEKCQCITSVSLLSSPHLSDAAFKVLAQGRKLVKLRIEGNNRITDASIKALSKSCPNLNHIYLADCQKITDASLKAVATLKNITVLNVADCIRISDPGVRQILEGPSGAKIQELNLTNCLRVSDLSLLRIAQKCHNLTFLSLRFCENVTDSGIELLGNMASLISIDLSGTSITDQGLAALGANSKIKELAVSECMGISDIGIQKFCQQSKDLELLDISHCLQVTNNTVKSLAFCCKMLTSISIAGCPKVTDLSIQYLSGVCHYLHILDFSGCVHLSDRTLKYLRKGCRQLRILRMLYCKSITKAAVLKMESKIQKVEYNNDDPPPWFGYDRHGDLLNGVSHLEETEEETGKQATKLFSSASVDSL
ncbi:dynein regulatory complex subunit 6 [Spea bombifrons]|uniref:dynein regulatory complex subunit 6 n=1 Tax=Spea bombifrons TaxID=233779 RepID=UPI002349443D|nr:dynein regulatory complex subunit 6 [Spea bombifrons]